MNELFRFVSVRPPNTAQDKNVADGGKAVEKSAFVEQLRESKDKAERQQHAQDFRKSDRFVTDLTTLKPPVPRLLTALARADVEREVDLDAMVRDELGAQRGDVLADAQFADTQCRLVETLIALRETGEGNSVQARRTAGVLAAFRLLEQAELFAEPVKARDLRAFLRGVVVAVPQLATPSRPQPKRDIQAQVAPKPAAGPKPEELTELRDKLLTLKTELDDARDADELAEEAGDDKKAQAARERRAGQLHALEVRTTQQLAKLRAKAGPLLSPAGLDLSTDTLTESIALIDDKLTALSKSGQQSAPANTHYIYYRGGLLSRPRSRKLGPAGPGPGPGPQLPPNVPAVQPDFSLPVQPSAVPQGVGYAHVLGVGDLMVVREETKRYAPGEVAHIENVLAGEYKDRSHRRTEKSEQSVFSSTEKETETERDLQSTERFQLGVEASEVQKADAKLEAGFNLSASYGPTVSVGANTSATLATSGESSKKSASTYSHDVTERAKNRVVERTREQRSRTDTLEIEEINKHGFDNKGKQQHVIGVYRWVDKIQQARLLNYGQRMMLEFIVPEPAAVYVQALFDTAPKGLNLEEPDKLITTLNAASIADDVTDPLDYRKLASIYQVTDIEPPPPLYTKLAENFGFAETEDVASQSATKKVAITDGYQAYKVVLTRSRSTSGSGFVMHAAAAAGAGPLTDYKREFALSHMVGELPLSVSYTGERAASVHATIYCERTDATFVKWQIKTYKSLIEGYQKMKSKYDEQLAVASLDRSARQDDFSPDRNRSIERTEIKRSVIEILTGQHFDLFGAITDDEPPRIDFAQAIAEGKYIQFFENAFEWSNMSYIMYPYFWGRHLTWTDKLGLDGADADHLAFLQAGAARVVAPVRPGYEPVLIHYLDTGEIWNGEDVPDLSSVSTPYVDITTEIREQQNHPLTEPVIVEEWEVKLPTSLVILQEDAILPEFDVDE